MSRVRLLLGAVMLVAVVTQAPRLLGAAGDSAPTSSRSTSTTAVVVVVTRVLDGDTLRVSTPSGVDLGRVRVLGIDAPEVFHEAKPAQCYGPEAVQVTTRLAAGAQTVTITGDPTQADRDRYGRLLRSVALDGTDLGGQLLAVGAARVFEPAGPVADHTNYQAAQQEAQVYREGMWGAC